MEERNTEKSRLLRDVVLAAAIILVSALLFLVFWVGGSQGNTAAVYIGNDLIGRYSLLIDAEYELNGGTNRLVIENQSARIEEANCPDGLCVHQGKISLCGERIVCLPNRLTVEIE